MEIILLIAILILSLLALVKGADFLVDGAADFAAYLKVSPILIGLTVVAFGTSLPEFIVSLMAVITGSADLSIGNVIGSNIANIGLVIGICAILIPLSVKSKTLMYEFPFLIVSSFLLLLLANNNYLFQENSFSLSRFDGLFFWIMFIIFIIYVWKSIKNNGKNGTKAQFSSEYKNENSVQKNSLLILIGIILLSLGGRYFVTSSSELALMFGLSEAFIGVTIVALGTSAPELFTSIIAALKGKADIAVGNIVGSNIFNVLFVLGTVSLIKPINMSSSLLFFDGSVMIGITLLFLLFATIGKKVERWEGATLLVGYLTYMGYLIYLI